MYKYNHSINKYLGASSLLHNQHILLKQGTRNNEDKKMLKSIKFWGTDSLKPITCAIYI